MSRTRQHPFMLPWYGTDRARAGYSCRVSRAVAELLGKGFPNRDRLLLGDGLRRDLTQQIINSIKHDWDLLDTENRARTELAQSLPISQSWSRKSANLSSIDLDGDRKAGTPNYVCRGSRRIWSLVRACAITARPSAAWMHCLPMSRRTPRWPSQCRGCRIHRGEPAGGGGNQVRQRTVN